MVVAQLTGIIPTVVAGGVAMKFTKAFLGNGQRKSPKRSKGRGGRSGSRYSPI